MKTVTLIFLLIGLMFQDPKPKDEEPTPVALPKVKPKEDEPLPVKPIKKDGKASVVPTSAVDGTDSLPATFVKNRIEQLKADGEGYVALDAVRVDTKRKCYLYPYSVVGPKVPERPVLIKKTAAGYQVVLDGVEHQWEAEDFDSAKWLPVNSVVVKHP